MSYESQQENLLAEDEAFECEHCPSVFFIQKWIRGSHWAISYRIETSWFTRIARFTCIMCKLRFRKESLFSKRMVRIHSENMKKKKSVLKVKINKEKEWIQKSQQKPMLTLAIYVTKHSVRNSMLTDIRQESTFSSGPLKPLPTRWSIPLHSPQLRTGTPIFMSSS